MDTPTSSAPVMKRINKYQFNLMKQLGSGSYANVYLGENIQTGEVVAIKMVDQKQIASETYLMVGLTQEIAVMKKLDSDNIVRLIDVVQTMNNYYIVQEYCDQGDFRSYLDSRGQLSEEEAKQVLTDILSGFLELLKHGIIHRDLKPENILILSKPQHQQSQKEQKSHPRLTFKLADFGFSRMLDNFRRELLNSLVGTPLYMSPQILTSQKYTSKSDIWSIGVLFYEMIYGKRPWSSNSLYKLVELIQSGKIEWEREDGEPVSELAIDFMKKCLQIEESKRIQWDEIYAHELFGDYFSAFIEKNKTLEDKALYIINSLRFKIHSTQTNLEELFKHFNLGKNSVMNFKELEALMKEIDNDLNREEIEFIFNKFDCDGDNTIDFTEFQKWLQVNNVHIADGQANGQEQQIQNNSFHSAVDSQKSLAVNQQQQQYASQQQLSQENQKQQQQQQQSKQPESMVTSSKHNYRIEDRAMFVIGKLRFAIEQFAIDVRELFNRYDKKKQDCLTLEQFMRMIKKIDERLQDEEIAKAFSLFLPDPSKNAITFYQFANTIDNIGNSVVLQIKQKQPG